MRISMKYPLSARSSVAVVAAMLLLSGCEGLGITPGESAPVAAAETGGTSISRDVERPDVFSVSEKALWDGRPSLGGVWVAYPANIDPERVIIRNSVNGKTVIGALFRRERDNPGPKIQLSSDAAVALGIVAGSPTEISIIVLRREEVEIAPPPAPAATVDDNMTLPERRGVQAAAAAAAPAPLPIAEPPAAAADVHPPEPASSAADLATIVEQTLADVPLTDTTAVDAPATEAPASEGPLAIFRLRKPFIQIGTFTNEANAAALVETLSNSGVSAQVQANEAENPTLWRVISGPYVKRKERAEQLRIIKGLGYTDAFFFK